MALFGGKKAQDLRSRVWEFEEFERFFEEENKRSGNSKLFQEAAKAFQDFADLRGTEINRENAERILEANQKLVEACRAYSQARSGAVTSSGRERLAVIDSLAMYQEGLNLDQVRDMRVMRENEGKTWEQLIAFSMSSTRLPQGKREVVGDQVNVRFKVEVDGRTGFFTEEKTVDDIYTAVDKIVGRIDGKTNRDLKEALDRKDHYIADRLAVMKGKTGRNKDGYEYKATTPLMCDIGEFWHQMERWSMPKGELGREVVGDEDNLEKASEIIKDYRKQLTEEGSDLSEKRKRELMGQAIESVLGDKGAYEDLERLLDKNREFLMRASDYSQSLEAASAAGGYRYAKLGLIQIRAVTGDRKQQAALDEAIADGQLAYECSSVSSEELEKAATAWTVGKMKYGDELTARNIATSRMAELLGIGHIVAHSEKMQVLSEDGRVMKGCFMEMARGIDLDSRDPRVQAMIEQVEVANTPSFVKDITTIEAFDFLCAQNDRHARNMLYQLSEPDVNGKRSITGIQGIDNDLSFGNKDEQVSMHQGFLRDMVFIDRELAGRIRALDKNSLQFALGDLLGQDQIDVMAKRVERFQKHMKENMVEIEPGGWELKEYSMDQPADKLDKRGKNYVQGLKKLDDGINERVGPVAFSPSKNYNIIRGFKQAKQRIAKERTEREQGPREQEKPQKVSISVKDFVDSPAARPSRRPSNVSLGKHRESVAKKQEQAVKGGPTV